ncbi:copper resistance protein B [Povalibacter sp.]|uniref:copper resistance protein B n=1 Tax=Povalibacter sp. TaxID=1962978 RepID=UPI002D1F9FDB|nr:copper resistance protein B [Povalibacter sp.]
MRALRLFAAILLSLPALTRTAHGQEHHHHEPAAPAPATTSAHVPPDPPSHLMGPMSPAEMAEIMAMDDAARFGSIAIDRLEWREGNDAIGWEGSAWYGGDSNKLMLKSEGDWIDGGADHTRTELLWDRVVARWWSVQAGVRHDAGEGPSRNWAAIGVEGLAPYWIDMEMTFYVGDAGRTALRFEGSHDMRLTQRLILQPQLEFNLYGKDDVDRGLGSGLSDLEAGLRLRYEIRREFAPYAGAHWKQRFGTTADLAAEDSEVEFVAGLRVWF